MSGSVTIVRILLRTKSANVALASGLITMSLKTVGSPGLWYSTTSRKWRCALRRRPQGAHIANCCADARPAHPDLLTILLTPALVVGQLLRAMRSVGGGDGEARGPLEDRQGGGLLGDKRY